MPRSMGQEAAEAWERFVRDEERRERDRVTTLHDWMRKANHVWVDSGLRRWGSPFAMTSMWEA